MTFILNPNLTAEGRSSDNMLALIQQMGASMALVRDSGKLVAMCAGVGIQTIFRAAGDDPAGSPLGQNPTAFVNARIAAAPQADYIHLTNEVGFSRELDAWTGQAALAAERAGKKVVAYNAATNQPLADWERSEQTLRWLVERGHAIGAHFYANGQDNPGGKAFLDLYQRVGGLWFMTEFAYAHVTHAPDGGYHISVERGYRADLSPHAKYNDWLDANAPSWAEVGIPLFLFSADQWPNNDAGKATGFGYEDERGIVEHCAVLNVRYPLKEKIPMPIINPPTSGGVPAALTTLPGAWINLRDHPTVDSADIGNLRVGETFIIFPAHLQGDWLYVIRGGDGAEGWVSLQGGRVAFTLAGASPPEPEPEVEAALGQLSAAKFLLGDLSVRLENAIALLKGAKLPDSTGTPF